MKRILKKLTVIPAILLMTAICLGVNVHAANDFMRTDTGYVGDYNITLDLQTKPDAGSENFYDGFDSLRANIHGIIKAYKNDALIWQWETPWGYIQQQKG